jgi:hypothetical protein
MLGTCPSYATVISQSFRRRSHSLCAASCRTYGGPAPVGRSSEKQDVERWRDDTFSGFLTIRESRTIDLSGKRQRRRRQSGMGNEGAALPRPVRSCAHRRTPRFRGGSNEASTTCIATSCRPWPRTGYGPARASAPPETTATHAKNLVETFFDVVPTCDLSGAVYQITTTSNLVEHETVFSDGRVHATFTQTGTLRRDAPDVARLHRQVHHLGQLQPQRQDRQRHLHVHGARDRRRRLDVQAS